MPGKVLKGLLIGGALIGAAFIPGLGTFAGIGLKSLFFATGASLAINSIGMIGVRTRQGTILQGVVDTQAPLPVVYGKTKLGIRYVDRRTTGPDNKDFYIVGALCHGSEDGTGIQAIDEIYLDDRLAVAADGTIQEPFVGLLAWNKHLGTDGQTVDAMMSSAFGTGSPPPWPTTSKGRGVAYIVLKLVYDAEVWATGEPVVTCIVRGCKVKDPRNLGAAAVWSDNPACCLWDYLTSTRWGNGSPTAELDATSFAAMANYCDTVVDKDSDVLTVGKLFTCNGWLDVGQAVKDNVATLLTSCRGILVYEGGVYRMLIRRVVSPVSLILTEDNIVGDWNYSVPGIGEAPNLLQMTYVEPGAATENYPHQAATRTWPRAGAANGYLTADNDYLAQAELSLPFTNDAYTAEQIGLVTLKEARAGIAVTLTATETALQLQVGDLVRVTHPSPGWTLKSFWVMGVFLLPGSGLVRLSLLEYDATAYTLDALNTIPTAPATSLPNPFAVAPPSDLELIAGDDQARPDRDGSHRVYIRATWTATPHPYLDYYEVQYRGSGNEVWLPSADPLRADLEARIGPVSEGTSYDVRVRAVNTLGKTSIWIEDSIVPHLPTLQRSGSFWIDDFSTQTPGRRWVQLDGTGTLEDIYDPDSLVGGKVGRVTGPAMFVLADAIPFDPNLLYSIRWRVRQLRDPAVGSKGFYIGVQGLREVAGQTGVYKLVNTFGIESTDNQHWVVAENETLRAGRAWTDLFAYLKGYAGATVPLTAAMLSQSGLGSFNAANLVDGDTTPTKVGFSTDAAAAGATLVIDLGVARTLTELRLHMAAEGSVAAFEFEFADDAGGPWTTVDSD